MWRFVEATPEGSVSAELFAPRSGLGVGYYHPAFTQHIGADAQSSALLPEETRMKVYDTAESVNATRRFLLGDSFLIEGDLGSGKSNILNYIAWRARQHEIPYSFVDLHNGLDQRRFQSVCSWAISKGGVLFVDSFDYLGAYADRTRSTNLVRIQKRADIAMQALDEFLSSNGQLVGTTHTEPWINRRMKYEAFKEWMGQIPTERIWGLMDAVELRHAVRMIGSTSNYPLPQDFLEELDEASDPHRKQYRVVKQLLVGPYDRALTVDERIAVINEHTRSKMGAPDDYSFLPS